MPVLKAMVRRKGQASELQWLQTKVGEEEEDGCQEMEGRAKVNKTTSQIDLGSLN